MALCSTCKPKVTLSVPGQCQKCSGLTSHFAHALCDACSTQLDECQWCRIPLSAGSASPIMGKTGIAFITVRHVDAGKTFKNLRIGEEIHIVLNEDQYKWREWNVKRPLSYNFKLKTRGNFMPDQGNPQFGTRGVFRLSAPAPIRSSLKRCSAPGRGTALPARPSALLFPVVKPGRPAST